MPYRVLRSWCAILSLAFLLLAGRSASAVELLVAPASLSASLTPGRSLVVNGQITNLTGVALSATDIFLSFSGYPHGSVQVTQLLGATDFTLPDGTFASSALFELMLLPGATPGDVLQIDFLAMDVNGVFSESQRFTLSVIPIPEPSAYAMLIAGLALLAVARRYHAAPRET